MIVPNIRNSRGARRFTLLHHCENWKSKCWFPVELSTRMRNISFVSLFSLQCCISCTNSIRNKTWSNIQYLFSSICINAYATQADADRPNNVLYVVRYTLPNWKNYYYYYYRLLPFAFNFLCWIQILSFVLFEAASQPATGANFIRWCDYIK